MYLKIKNVLQNFKKFIDNKKYLLSTCGIEFNAIGKSSALLDEGTVGGGCHTCRI